MKRWIAALLFLFLWAGLAQAAERLPVTVSESSALPLRVLTRPLSSLYKDDTAKVVLESNLPAFKPYFVYTRPSGEALESGSGWYEVGSDDAGTIVGWLKGEDIFEWKQTMCLAYTHPEGRHPVLMFDDKDKLEALVKGESADRIKDITGYYASIDSAAAAKTALPKDFPVVSVEPKLAVDLTKQFYLLPILEYDSVTLDGREGRLLRIAAVSNSGEKSRESSDLRENIQYVQTAAGSSQDNAAKLEDLKIDLVWVIDTTRSMQPYINKVQEVVRSTSKNIAADPGLNDKIAFGVWAYRDSESISGIEYNTRNFTPELLAVNDFVTIIELVKETPVDSVDMAEDMFSGIDDAIAKTRWRENALRIIVLVGDAPSHEAGHKWNASGKEENTLRTLATESRASIMALHLKPPRTQRYNKIAEKQFKTLSTNPGSNTPLYWGINANDVDGFGKASEDITGAVVEYAKAGVKAMAEAAPAAQDDTPGKEDIRNLLKAASVTWLGSQVNAMPPRDIEAWVADKDLEDPAKQSLEVRLLLNKRQLSSLATLLDEVLQAGRYNQLSGETFFDSLQAASAVASRDPNMLSKAPDLAKSGLIPDFLSGLPYHSQLMDMNNNLWASWGPDEQNSFLNSIEAKVKAYTSLHDNPEIWVSLNSGDDPSEYVAPVPLDLLP